MTLAGAQDVDIWQALSAEGGGKLGKAALLEG